MVFYIEFQSMSTLYPSHLNNVPADQWAAVAGFNNLEAAQAAFYRLCETWKNIGFNVRLVKAVQPNYVPEVLATMQTGRRY